MNPAPAIRSAFTPTGKLVIDALDLRGLSHYGSCSTR